MYLYVSRKYPCLVAEKAMDLGNLALAGLVFAQLLPGQRVSGRLLVMGVIVFALAQALAFYASQFCDEGGEI